MGKIYRYLFRKCFFYIYMIGCNQIFMYVLNDSWLSYVKDIVDLCLLLWKDFYDILVIKVVLLWVSLKF